MSHLTSGSTMAVHSLGELVAAAVKMEKESLSRYADLAAKMRVVGRQDVADVFEGLAHEESSHAEKVLEWFQQTALLSQIPPATEATGSADEVDGAEAPGLSAELLDAYRSLSIAVRNVERAFAFWSDVAANTRLPLVRAIAQQMAQDELEHAKTLRRERTRVSSQHWRLRGAVQELHDLSALELEVCKGLEERKECHDLALEARALSLDLASDPLQEIAPVGPPPPRRLVALCEWLADYYVEAGESLPTNSARERAQALASIAIRRLAVVRTALSS